MRQLTLFRSENNQLPVEYIANFLTLTEADELYNHCQNLEWQQNNIKMMGKTMPVPRLECMYGDPGCDYLYSKSVLLEPLPWTNALQKLRSHIELQTGYPFNIVLFDTPQPKGVRILGSQSQLAQPGLHQEE